MVKKALEPTEKLEEQKQPAPEATLVAPAVVSPETEQVVSAITQEDIDKAKREAREEAEREWQSRKDREFQPLKDQIETLKQQAREAREKAELGELGDTQEVRDFQTKRRELEDKETALNEKVAKQAELDIKLNERAKVAQAAQLAEQYGIDKKDLLKANSPEEMELVALRASHEKLKAQTTEPAAQKVDSGVPVTTGQGWRDLSSEDMIKRGYEQKTKIV